MQESNGIKIKIDVENMQAAIAVFGNRDDNVNYLRKKLGVNINMFDNAINVEGEEELAVKAEELIKLLLDKALTNTINKSFIRFCMEIVDNGDTDRFDELAKTVAVTAKGKQIRCKTYGQARYVAAIRNNSVVFGIGPEVRERPILRSRLQCRCTKITCRRSGRTAGIFAGRSGRKSRSVSKTALRRVAGDVRHRSIYATHGKGHHRDRAFGVYERQDALQRIYNIRRGSKYHERANEDVFDENGRGQQSCRHRRRHAD